MKLRNFKIKSLHDVYNYNISFNDDVTFIHGPNGCGKTTILNIINNIITGSFSELFQYSFKNIELCYLEVEELNRIIINRISNSKLEVFYKDQKRIFNKNDYINTFNFSHSFNSKNENPFFETYPWLKEIKESFNLLFLPLSRNNLGNSESYENTYDEDVYYIKRNFQKKNTNTSENSIDKVKPMIKDSYFNIMAQINGINDKFRNDIFKTLFQFNGNESLSMMLNIDDEFYKSKDKLKETFKEMNILTKKFEKEIDRFYTKFLEIQELQELQLELAFKADSSRIAKDLTTLISNYSRIHQIIKISDLVDEMNIQKEKVMLPIETFLNSINSFFEDSEIKKEVNVDKNTGEIYFTVNNSRKALEIDKLSSGEQQLVIFFSSIIFGLGKSKQGIFIVDEPELSLHLAWQNKFVKTILSIDNNLQLILATHSPEIISNYRNKAAKMILNNDFRRKKRGE